MRSGWRALTALVLFVAQGWSAAEPATAGRSIYLEGLRASGEPVHATVQKTVALSGAAAACVNCHRRSGFGGSEGQSSVRPIAGRLLFASTQANALVTRWGAQALQAASRASYTREALARALREGVDPTGRTLDPLMPRYELSDAEIAQLEAYLNELSPRTVPGVDEREIHFATVIAPGVRPEKRRAMLGVLQAFFKDKNGDTRKEVRRREVAIDPMYQAYRTWVLHVWELQGPPETWAAQLEALYREQPVFAVIGGLGEGSWQPLHVFCEATALPCLLPDVDDPVVGGAGYYTVYFSRGIALEADLLAAHLSKDAPKSARIVQVYREDERGQSAARALREALRRKGIEGLVDQPLDKSTTFDAAFWSGFRQQRPTVLVAWLDAADVKRLSESPPLAALESVYLSASLTALGHQHLVPAAWRSRTRIVWPFAAPANWPQHLARASAWLRAKGIALTDARVQANTYFAATLAGDAISHLGDGFSRDYFIERIEHMTASALSPSIYPRLSLGPGQRFASRGGYILAFPQEGAMPMPLGDWLVP